MTGPPYTPARRFGALHARDYRRYFALGLVAMTADNIEHVISYWVMFQKFHSPALAGFAVISHWVPFLLFSVYAGGLADRYDCRRLIQASQGMFMIASAAWGLLFLTDTLRMWHAVGLLVLHGAAGVLGAPAAQLIIHDMVAPAQLPSAVRLNATSRHLAILLGPAVGGGLMLLCGPAWGLLVNLFIYLPFSVLLVRLPQTGHAGRTEPEGAPPRAPRLGFAEAFRVLAAVRTDRRLVTMLLLGAATSFFVGSAFQAQMPEYAHDLGSDDGGARYSILLAGNAAGAVLGAVLLESLALLRPSPRVAIVCAAAWGTTIAGFALTRNYPVAVTLLVLAGVFNIAFTSMAQTLVQILAPPPLRGRVVGLFNTAQLGLRAGSGVTVGVLGAVLTVHWSLALSAGAVVLVALGLLARERHAARIDRDRPGGVEEPA